MEVRLETPEEAWSGHSGRPYTGDGYPPTFNEGPDIREQRKGTVIGCPLQIIGFT